MNPKNRIKVVKSDPPETTEPPLVYGDHSWLIPITVAWVVAVVCIVWSNWR